MWWLWDERDETTSTTSSTMVNSSLIFDMEPRSHDVGGRAILNVGEYGNEDESGVNICDASVLFRCSVGLGGGCRCWCGALSFWRYYRWNDTHEELINKYMNRRYWFAGQCWCRHKICDRFLPPPMKVMVMEIVPFSVVFWWPSGTWLLWPKRPHMVFEGRFPWAGGIGMGC